MEEPSQKLTWQDTVQDSMAQMQETLQDVGSKIDTQLKEFRGKARDRPDIFLTVAFAAGLAVSGIIAAIFATRKRSKAFGE